MTSSSLVVAVVAVVVVTLAACGQGAPSATPSTTRTVTVTADPASPASPVPATAAAAVPTDEPSAPASSAATGQDDASTDAVEREPSGEQVFLVGARVGTHDGYDRVVWEVEGDGTPGWRIGWTDDPRRDGSGEPVDLPGEVTLQVVLVGVGVPPDAPAGVAVYDGPQRLAGGATAVVTEVEVGQVFEGYLTGFVGARRESPFEVTLLSDPTRVVVDVQH